MVNSSLSFPLHHCFGSRTSVSIFTAFAITKMLLCGHLSIRVLCSGHRRWRSQGSTTSSSSSLIGYHMAAMELVCLAACAVYFYCSYAASPVLARAGLDVFSMTVPGEMCFHCLTCVERYLAVVHPVRYRRLRQSGGPRSISIGCVWLLCLGWMAIKPLYTSNFPIVPFFCFSSFSLSIVSFCSLSVLCALVRPGPGDVGGEGKRVHRSKQRALVVVTAILAALWLWIGGTLVSFSVEASSLLSYTDGCVVMMLGVWLGLPSSLVLPLLFLHRSGNVTSCRHGTES